MLIVLKGTSCPKGSKEGGQQCCQEQGDHSGNPTAGLLCNSGTSQQTQSPQIGEFSEDLPKSGGEGLGLWLRWEDGLEGGKQRKQRSYSSKLSKSSLWEFPCQPLHDLVLTKPKFILIFMRYKMIF